jgi:hypothetical protein
MFVSLSVAITLQILDYCWPHSLVLTRLGTFKGTCPVLDS